MKLDNYKINISNKQVLKKLGCTEKSPLFEEFWEELSEIKEEALSRIKPVSAIAFGELPEILATPELPVNSKVVYVITSIGEKISNYGNDFFEEGDCVKGMLVDALADTYLFEYENSWVPQLIEACKMRSVGIERRLEIPEDLPMEAQKVAFEAIGKEELGGLILTSGYMFLPIKTICNVFLLGSNPDVFKATHNCRVCSNITCNMRKVQPVTLTVHSAEETYQLECAGEDRILDTLQKKHRYTAICGKKGLCGKCKIRVLKGTVEPTAEDRTFFTEKELQEGWRLSCRAYPQTDCEIELSFGEGDFEVVTWGKEPAESKYQSLKQNTVEQTYGIAVDIGTTTLAAQLVDIVTGEVKSTAVSLNHQRAYGADVISRIQASNQGKQKELQASIQKDLQAIFIELLKKFQIKKEQLKKIFISGNTTMGHLLMGYSCEELGRIPFKPVTLEKIQGSAREILGENIGESGISPETKTCLLPGISAFVGADILSGMVCCGFAESEEVNLFLDLGTNGEMALGCKDRILVTSTAAGPAFEGGNIRWGKGSVPGAICRVQIGTDGFPKVETIGGHPPIGICGTGVIEIAAELLTHEWMDETGRLVSEYAETGYPLAKTQMGKDIVFTQKDIRELQMAKAAVRAGMDILLEKYGISYEQIAQVYLAGGFGYQVNKEKASLIGLLPVQLLDRITVVGNSSLTGAKISLLKKNTQMRMEQIRSVCQEVSLARETNFQERFVDAMYFEN